MREIRRFPTQGDFRAKKNSDAEFPSEKVYRRFGTKHQFAAKIKEYCSGRAGYDDIVALCTSVPLTKHVLETEVPDAPEFGFVYLLKSGRYYKIGKSNAVGRRERELAIQLPVKAMTIHSIKTDDPSGIEAYWHKRFELKRIRRDAEWFDLDTSEVRAFLRKFM